ncbi:hypothetical protein [Ferruginibacter sp. SUN106]|uniref:hypothetical protein n=1 Tax=Ferruginibacter sp. SUN106 TaxID=2978348 RepID=UPI003D366C86
MKYIIIICLIAFSHTVFGQSDEFKCLKKSGYEFVSNASLSKTGTLAVDTGSNIIFRLSREYDCTPAIFDDEILLRVAWEIPGNTTACKLQISDKDSMNLPLIYIVRRGPDVYENQT